MSRYIDKYEFEIAPKEIKYFDDYYETLNGVSGLALVTEWNEFRNPDFEKMKQMMKEPVIFDGRNIYILIN